MDYLSANRKRLLHVGFKPTSIANPTTVDDTNDNQIVARFVVFKGEVQYVYRKIFTRSCYLIITNFTFEFT